MPQDAVRVLQVTDPHLFAEEDGSLRGTATAATLRSVVEHIGRQQWPADFVASTGDIIQDDSAAAYQRFKEIMAPIGLPIHCVPGNHDVRSLMQEALSDEPWHYCESFEIGNWHIVGVDSCIEGDAGGHVSAEELARLKDVLESVTAPHVAVFLHHPPLEMGSKWLDSVGLRNASEFLDVVTATGKVRTAVFGHVHQAFDKMYESVRIIGTPSSCAQFKPFADDFELDDKPPAYRRICLNQDGSIETELIWMETDE
ncbi:MAG: 3',5'-cyclic-AMP phosphodiesterase [Woeseiaceae bacterium]